MSEPRSSSEWGRFSEESPERHALVALSDYVHVDMRPQQLQLEDGTRSEIQGAAQDGSAVAQMMLKGGDFSSQHRNRLMADMFKLVWLRTTLTPQARCLLVVGPAAVPGFRPGGWLARSARDTGIEVLSWDGTCLTPVVTPADFGGVRPAS